MSPRPRSRQQTPPIMPLPGQRMEGERRSIIFTYGPHLLQMVVPAHLDNSHPRQPRPLQPCWTCHAMPTTDIKGPFFIGAHWTRKHPGAVHGVNWYDTGDLYPSRPGKPLPVLRKDNLQRLRLHTHTTHHAVRCRQVTMRCGTATHRHARKPHHHHPERP